MKYIDLNNISSDDENEDEYADMPPLISVSDDEKMASVSAETSAEASDETSASASKLEWQAVCLSFMLLMTAFVLPFLVGAQKQVVAEL